MDLKEIFSKTNTSLPSMVSELIETQCMIKSMLSVIMAELANGNPEKEAKMVSLVNKLKEEELLRVVGRFTNESKD